MSFSALSSPFISLKLNKQPGRRLSTLKGLCDLLEGLDCFYPAHCPDTLVYSPLRQIRLNLERQGSAFLLRGPDAQLSCEWGKGPFATVNRLVQSSQQKRK